MCFIFKYTCVCIQVCKNVHRVLLHSDGFTGFQLGICDVYKEIAFISTRYCAHFIINLLSKYREHNFQKLICANVF